MRITANSESFEVPDGSSLSDFLRSRELAIERVVVERNGQPLTPGEARATQLEAGDRLEIVRIVAGG